MKKHLIVIALAILAFSCKKKPEMAATPTTGADTATYSYIKQWKNDTLLGIFPSHTATHADTIFTQKSGDTSLFYYHGIKHYVFYKKYPVYSSDSERSYIDCFITPHGLDTTGKYSTCQVMCYRYWDASLHSWKSQTNEIILSKVYPHFDTASGSYYAHLP